MILSIIEQISPFPLNEAEFRERAKATAQCAGRGRRRHQRRDGR